MSVNSKYLEKHGWRKDSSRKQGMITIVRWYHPDHGIHNQEQAVWLQRDHNKFVKMQAAKQRLEVVSVNQN